MEGRACLLLDSLFAQKFILLTAFSIPASVILELMNKKQTSLYSSWKEEGKKISRLISVGMCLYDEVQSFKKIPWDIWLCKYLLVARFENEENATGQILKH